MFRYYRKSYWLFLALNLTLLTLIIVLNNSSPDRYGVNVLFTLFVLFSVIGCWYMQPGIGPSVFDRVCGVLMSKCGSMTSPERSSRKSAIAIHSGLIFQIAAQLVYELMIDRDWARIGVYSILLLLALSALTIYRSEKLLPREGILLLAVTIICPIALYIYENGFSQGVTNSALLLMVLPVLLSLFLFGSVRTRMIFNCFSVLMLIMLFVEIHVFENSNYSAAFSFFICVFSLSFSVYSALELYIRHATDEYYNLSGALQQLTNAQSMLVHHEKMVTLGQLIAGVAHEINTPIGAVKASAETLHSALIPSISMLLRSGKDMTDLDDFLFLMETAIESFKEMNSSMSVRRAKNALRKYFEEQGVSDPSGFAEALSRIELVDIDKVKKNIDIFLKESCAANLELLMNIIPFINGTQTILFASEKVTKIVFALRSYAHTNASGEVMAFDVAKTIDNVLVLYHNQLKMGVQVSKNYDEDLPEIMGNADELGQVWTNLVQNALQAMNNNGQLRVSIGREDNYLVVAFADSGCGIAEKDYSKVFEPFYTTKQLGEGTGLGLDISRSIVEKHGGTITFTSKVGVGTTFTVRLPVNKEANHG